MIIAIDGPAASGKSTAARALARRLGLTFLDTGAMYRAVTLEVLDRGIDPGNEFACTSVAESCELRFDGAGRIQINGAPGEPMIRGPEVTRHVSEVASHPGVRRALVAEQRAIAAAARTAGAGIVAEGRDTTSVVFPNADLKVFLVASPRVRAVRRALEEGAPERVDEYEEDIARRDRYDSTRADSPLVQVAGALRLDTDELGPEDVLERLIEAARSLDPGSKSGG
jgi:cytidylate kinase